ncbi:MAG: YncE family protein [Methylocapsa sp.]|nr:YncE family protein [Methylocapsa sp.]
MRTNRDLDTRDLLLRGFAALWAALILVFAFAASPAKAAPFVYVTNNGSNNVTVIDTFTNKVVATVPLGSGPRGVAVTPDGKKVYAGNGNSVSVIAAASNKVVASIPIGSGSSQGVAIGPDGKHVYVVAGVANCMPGSTVAVIDTASNQVVAKIPANLLKFGINEACAGGIALTPDGKQAYVTGNVQCSGCGWLWVIDTAANKVAQVEYIGDAPASPFSIAISPDGNDICIVTVDGFVGGCGGGQIIGVGGLPLGVTFAPDSRHAYVTVCNGSPDAVSVIDTATGAVAATIPVGSCPDGVAVSPDGKQVYAANSGSDTVSVIDTRTNKVAATIPAGKGPSGVGIIPAPPGVPFSVFSARLAIRFWPYNLRSDDFNLNASFTLGSASNGIDPSAEPVTIKIGTFALTIPRGSFKGTGFGPFEFQGVIEGVSLKVGIEPTGAKRYAFHAVAQNANLQGATNSVPVTLIIGDDSGFTSINAQISPAGGQAQRD